MARAFYSATTIPGADAPYNAITVKIHYPAVFGDTLFERNTGSIPPDTSFGAMPVVIMAPGINVPFETFSWLGNKLAEAGIVMASFQVISELMPDEVHLTAALDLDANRVENIGKYPCGLAFQPVLNLLKRENESGLLAGALDLTQVWFGGHSAGGSTALLSASRDWFPELQGVFAYAAHTGISTMLGHPENYVHPVKDIPLLLMGGSRDGCIANSAHRYGDTAGDPNGRIIETFEKASNSWPGTSYMALIEGANHFTLADTTDRSTGRAFIDFDEECDGDAARDLIAEMVIAFVRGDDAAMGALLRRPEIADGRRK